MRDRGTRNQKMIRPASLRRGDKVGIIAPASNIDRKAFERGVNVLSKLGYHPVYSQSILSREIYFAGPAERRVGELEAMFESADIRAILCARGGYGANHLLSQLDIRKVKRNPKIFVGYSDVTTLLTWFTDNGLVTFHGPMVAKDFAHPNGVDLDAWDAVLGGQMVAAEVAGEAEIQPLISGKAKGILYGGCLSLLVASLGTPYEIQTDGKLLFIEDIGAKPYQIDRMLMQLRLAGKLRRVRGIIFGQMMECIQPGGQSYTLQEILKRLVSDLGIPVAFGFPSGHVSGGNFVLPFGVEAMLEVTRSRVRFSMDAATVG